MEIFIKPTIRYHYTLTRVTEKQTIKKTQAIKSSEECEHRQNSLKLFLELLVAWSIWKCGCLFPKV